MKTRLTILRKITSLFVIFSRNCTSYLRVAKIKAVNQGAVIPWSTQVGPGVFIQVTDGGKLTLQNDVKLSVGSTITAQGGVIEIGNNSFIGKGCTIVSKELIIIGADALIGEYVTIRDQDHASSSRPYRKAGYKISPIAIGDNVWLGCKVSVLRGSVIGSDSIVGANSVVNSDLPSDTMSAGSPATVIKFLDSPH